MKHISLIILVVIGASAIAAGQTKTQAGPTPLVIQRLDSPELAEAQRQAIEAERKAVADRTTADASSARSEAAQLRVVNLVLIWMADNGYSTKDWRMKGDQGGGLYLERVPPAPSPAVDRPPSTVKP